MQAKTYTGRQRTVMLSLLAIAVALCAIAISLTFLVREANSAQVQHPRTVRYAVQGPSARAL